MINPNDPLTAFVISILDDDEGINENAFEKLVTLLEKQGEDDILWFVNNRVESNNGRFYLPTVTAQRLQEAITNQGE